MTNQDANPVGHSGLTYQQWQDRRVADVLAGRSGALYEPHAFEREFVADADGWLPLLTGIGNTVTGDMVTLAEPIRVHVDDLDRVIAEHQARFLAEWEASRG